MFEVTVQDEGGEIALLTVKDQVARVLLRRRFPYATIIGDFDDGEWREWEHWSDTAFGVLAGLPCGPYSPSEKGGVSYPTRGRVTCSLLAPPRASLNRP